MATRGNSYTIDLDGGRYAIWARVHNPSTWASTPAGKEARPSAWFIVGDHIDVIDSPTAVDCWTWIRIGQTTAVPAGTTTITLRARQGGIAIERIALTSPTFDACAVEPTMSVKRIVISPDVAMTTPCRLGRSVPVNQEPEAVERCLATIL